jgi:2-methylcitrate dehydratase PrpD
VIDALVLGIDVACRIGNVMYPDHYDRGWHITGSTGMLGAAAACARLLKLDEQQTQMALGIAASQPVGLREQFGTMTKPFHPGGAARAGLMSALLASKGFTSSPRALEAPRGFVQVARTSAPGTRPPTNSASASRSRSTPTSPSPAASSSTPASTPACSCASRA